MQINKRQFKKWIAALDSRQYKQTTGQLQNQYGYCCLGVCCKVTIPHKLLSLDNQGRIDGGVPESQPASPKWLNELTNDFAKRTGQGLLVLNDELRFTFPEIATLLELVYVHKILD